ncbi:hypothetical protein [Pseudonocardia sp.]|uniref:hypothetical protein n=1 Tax=Pseudonocardia sp. TaxID=60912 RepID=UPI003D1038CA
MANQSGGGVSTVLLLGLAGLIVLGLIGCSNTATTAPPSGQTLTAIPDDVQIQNVAQMTQMAGEEVAAQGVRVDHVAADEGFWLDLVGGRVWVTLVGSGESPYTVRDGDVVSFQGRIVPHGPTYPAPLGMCSQADYDALSAQPSHIEVPYDALAFGVG